MRPRKRTSILDATVQVIETRGVTAVSCDSVAEAADLTKGPDHPGQRGLTPPAAAAGDTGRVRDDDGGDAATPAVGKVDLKHTIDSYRARAGEFRVLEVPPLRYLMVDGTGDPNTAEEYADAVAALYPVAYAAKFASKRDLGRDYVVPPLEALWWADDMASFTSRRDKERWRWTAMLLVPNWVDEAMLHVAVDRVAATQAPAALGRLRWEVLVEATCVQTLHVGPYDDEGPVLERMHREVIPAAGLVMTGCHHEVYLSDPRRAAPARLRTILRQPVATDVAAHG